ncbi:uncharacterized protein G2W53_004176 [Senna tora]|uniref:Uncharacterized protein n=1 Tax=Senna tora TaxID=362788 RepID=A0A834XCF9_9FABA|nr:uncharacterized protein G2W53_004176 [Senna tora]
MTKLSGRKQASIYGGATQKAKRGEGVSHYLTKIKNMMERLTHSNSALRVQATRPPTSGSRLNKEAWKNKDKHAIRSDRPLHHLELYA